MIPDRAWRLHPQVAVRPEPFGALLYHFGTRKLSFLKDRTILAVVQSLADYPDVRAAAAPRESRTPDRVPTCMRWRAGRGSNMLVPAEAKEGRMTAVVPRLIEQFEHGLDAPICLTWELTYACNLACVHCLSSSGKRDPRELSTQACKDIIDELERMQVFYVNIGGGEPTVRPDFWELVDYATAHHVA